MVGAYAVVIISKDNPESLIGARREVRWWLGGEDEFFIASDATPLIEYTRMWFISKMRIVG